MMHPINGIVLTSRRAFGRGSRLCLKAFARHGGCGAAGSRPPDRIPETTLPALARAGRPASCGASVLARSCRGGESFRFSSSSFSDRTSLLDQTLEVIPMMFRCGATRASEAGSRPVLCYRVVQETGETHENHDLHRGPAAGRAPPGS